MFLFSFVNINAQNNEEQGTPLFRNYLPREYRGYSQNWSVVQSKTGLLYFANGDGVLEYDGSKWRLVASKTKITATSLVMNPSGQIFVGAIGDFGVLKTNEHGRMEFYSLLSNFPDKLKDFSFVYNMIYLNGGVYFNTSNGIYCWKNNKISFTPLTRVNTIFNYRNKICVWQEKIGLSTFENSKLKSLHLGSFKDTSIISILPFDDHYDLAITRAQGVFLLANLSRQCVIKPFNFQINSFYYGNQMINALKMMDGRYAIASMRGGTVIFNHQGQIELVLNKSIGIMNDSHNYVSQDNQGNLWMALDNGISKAEISSPLSYWDDASGLKGSVLSVTKCNGSLYAATWQGLYRLEKNIKVDRDADDDNSILGRSNSFNMIKGITSHCWDLMSVNSSNLQDLIVASTSGIYVYRHDKVERIVDYTSFKLMRLKKYPELFLAATSVGMAVFKIESGVKNKYKYIGFVKGLDFKSNSIVEDQDGKIWFDVNLNSVGYFTIRKDTLNIHAKEIIEQFHFDVKLFDRNKYFKGVGQVAVNTLFGKPLFLTNKGVYRLTKNNEEEIISPLIPTIHSFFSNHYDLISFYQDKLGRMWFQVSSKVNKVKMLGVCYRVKGGKFRFVFAPFKPIPSMEIYAIYPDKNGNVWIGGDDGLFEYNTTKRTSLNVKFKTLLREVHTKKDSLVFQGYYNINGTYYAVDQPDSLKIELSYKYNSFKFDIAAPIFFDERFTEYSRYLDGYDASWTEWGKISEKEYTNLPHGDYVFHAKARDIFGNIGTEVVFRFSIAPPWYLRTWSFIAYFILFLLLLYLGIVITNQRLLSAKIRLERIVRDRTSEVIARQKEIEIEKDRSEKLLLNILPYKVAEELKNKGSASTQVYENASVMFSDMKGFTTIAQTLPPEQLIKELDLRFVMFDEVCMRRNLEKIKTIGDAYMCAGGVPIANNTHAIDIVLAAFEMLDFIDKLNRSYSSEEMPWELRVGIHSGPLIAGVVGRNKFAYDIWGDTVNTASRMESSSLPGKINVSGYTYDLIKDFFTCNYRGKIPVKNKGYIDMFYVERIKPELSNDLDGHSPNKDFMDLYKLLAIKKGN